MQHSESARGTRLRQTFLNFFVERRKKYFTVYLEVILCSMICMGFRVGEREVKCLKGCDAVHIYILLSTLV